MLGPYGYGDASACVEAGFDFAPAWGKGGYQVVEQEVGEMFVEDAFVPKGPKIELQGLRFHDAFFGHVANANLSKVRLARFGAQACELVCFELYDVVAFGIAVWKRFQLTLGGGCPLA